MKHYRTGPETKRLHHRVFTVDDAEEFFVLNSNPDVMRFNGEPLVPSLEVAIDAIAGYPDFDEVGYGRWACVLKKTQTVIGFCGLKYLPDLDAVDLGYRFLPEFWGQSIATEACRASLEFGFRELRLDQIHRLGASPKCRIHSCVGEGWHATRGRYGLRWYEGFAFCQTSLERARSARGISMNRSPFLIVAILVAGSVGCDLVTLDGPIGDPLTEAEKATFVGRWINEASDVFELRLTNDQKLVMGSISWDDDRQQHRATNSVIDARKVGEAIYFLAHEDPQDIGFVRIIREPELDGQTQFKMLVPDAAKFRKAVEAGKLAGNVLPRKNSNYTVRIHADSPLTEPVFSSDAYSDWYLVKDALTFRRIKRLD